MKRWQLQKAKAHFSELVKEAKAHGPQSITVHGREEAVILSAEDFDKLWPKETLWDFIRSSPLVGAGLKLDRDKHSEGRATPFELPS